MLKLPIKGVASLDLRGRGGGRGSGGRSKENRYCSCCMGPPSFQPANGCSSKVLRDKAGVLAPQPFAGRCGAKCNLIGRGHI